MQTVTTLQLEAAFVAAIQALTPTLEPLRSARWSYTPSQRRGGKALLMGKATRAFDLLFGVGEPDYAWFGSGEAYACKVAVAVSYAAVEASLLQHMLTADAVDLRRVLSMLRDPTVPGLSDVVAGGIQNEAVDSEANVYVEHVFTVHYHQSTDTY
jgi:hypothetical protein